MIALGIDPGQQGAFVTFDGRDFDFEPMPLNAQKEIDFEGVREILAMAPVGVHIFLERAMPLAMGAKHAFNYGRGFAAIEIAIQLSGLPVTYVEPAKWAKVMHEGISRDLKPKAKSAIAVERLLPQLAPQIPRNKNGKLHEGFVDALLIALFGLRRASVITANDF